MSKFADGKNDNNEYYFEENKVRSVGRDKEEGGRRLTMAGEQETSDDVLAAMRNYSNTCNDGYRTDYGVVCSDMRSFADRLEVAIKRERAATGREKKGED